MPILVCGFDDPVSGLCARPPVDRPDVARDLGLAAVAVHDESLPVS